MTEGMSGVRRRMTGYKVVRPGMRGYPWYEGMTGYEGYDVVQRVCPGYEGYVRGTKGSSGVRRVVPGYEGMTGYEGYDGVRRVVPWYKVKIRGTKV